MTFILGLIGWVLGIGSIVVWIINPKPQYKDDYGHMNDTPSFLLNLYKGRFVTLSIGVVGIFLSLSLFFAQPGHQYYVISPTGNVNVITSSGYKIVLPFSRVTEWQKYIDVKVVVEGESEEGIEGIIKDGIPIRFIDQVTGIVKISARFELPSDIESFTELAETFRTPENLTNNTLTPTLKEQTINTGYMFAAQDYISGAASDFRQTLDDQLKNGGFSVVREEQFDTLYSDIQVNGKRVIKDIKSTYIIQKREKNGVPIRIDHDIKKNNINIAQVIVDQVILEPAFKKRLEKQRDISAQKRIELESIETAQAEQQRIVAEGERDKAAERVNQEKKQVATLIAIETNLKEEETNKKLAAIQLETEKLRSATRKVSADAKRYELSQADGLSEEDKFMMTERTKQITAIADAVKGAKWPVNYTKMGGDTGKGGGDPLADMVRMMTMQMAQAQKVSGIK